MTDSLALEATASEIHHQNTHAMLEIENCLMDGGLLEHLALDDKIKSKIKTQIAQWCSQQRKKMQKNIDMDGYVIPWEELINLLETTSDGEKVYKLLKKNCGELENYTNPSRVAEGISPIPPKAIGDIQGNVGGYAGGLFAAAADSDRPADGIPSEKR